MMTPNAHRAHMWPDEENEDEQGGNGSLIPNSRLFQKMLGKRVLRPTAGSVAVAAVFAQKISSYQRI